MTPTDDDELTPEELVAFATLPRHAAIDQLAEQRTVQLLHTRGLLLPRASRLQRTLGMAGAIAAALVLFAAGTLFGKSLAMRESRTGSPSIQVQQAGTAYVHALMRLGRSSAERPRNLVAGLEAGTATLRAAATTIAGLDPGDSTVRRIRTSLDATRMRPEVIPPTSDASVIWF